MTGRRLLTVALSTGAIVAMGAGTAFAGELTGNGREIEVKARSICAYSGLDDADDDGFGRTQNWGQIPKAVRDEIGAFGQHPGEACNAHLNPYSGGEH